MLFLILAFVNAAGLFVLMGAEFLAMILIVVYVGAVAVLFLFVVMMLDVDFAELQAGLRCNICRSACWSAASSSPSCCWWSAAWAIGPGVPQAIAAPIPTNIAEHRGARPRALHALRLLLRGRRPGPAGRHDRRHRADAAAQASRVKRQNIARQVARTQATAIEIVKVQPGQGLGSNA